MSLRTRRILFTISLALFIVALGPILLYTLGYRVNWHTFTVEKTGGLYIAVEPTGARVYINDSFVRETPTLSRGALIQDLKPKSYDLRVEKDGYAPWQKTVVIEPGQVFEARVVLTPKSPARSILVQGSLTDMAISPTGLFAIFNAISSDNKPELRLYSIRTSAFLAYGDAASERIAGSSFLSNQDVYWQKNEDAAIISTADDWIRISIGPDNHVGAESLYKNGPLRAVFKVKPRLVVPNPHDANGLLILDGTNFYIWGSSKSSHAPILQTVAGVVAASDHLMLLDNQNGTLYRTLPDATAPEEASPARLPVPLTNTRVEELSRDRWLVASAHGSWVVETGTSTLVTLAQEPMHATYNAGASALLWWSSRTLGMRWFGKTTNLPYYQTRPDEIIFASPDKEIRGAFIYPNADYVIAAIGESVQIIELDPRGSARNITPLYSGASPEFWIPENETAGYILDDGDFIKVNLETPSEQ